MSENEYKTGNLVWFHLDKVAYGRCGELFSLHTHFNSCQRERERVWVGVVRKNYRVK